MAVNAQLLKFITLDIGGENFEAQLRTWKLVNETDDAEVFPTFAPDSSYAEPGEPKWNLELTFVADWRANGVSDYLTAHDGETVTFQLDHLYDVVGQHVRWNGNVLVKAPDVGGDVRTIETTEITLTIVGEPTYSRP